MYAIGEAQDERILVCIRAFGRFTKVASQFVVSSRLVTSHF